MIVICNWVDGDKYVIKKNKLYEIGRKNNRYTCNNYLVDLETGETSHCVKTKELKCYGNYTNHELFATFEPACEALNILLGVEND